MLEVKNLSQMINLQKGAVSKKRILSKKYGDVVLLALDQDQKMSEHTAPADALVVVLEGEVELIFKTQSYFLKTGETLTIPALEPHSVAAKTPLKMMLVIIRDDE